MNWLHAYRVLIVFAGLCLFLVSTSKAVQAQGPWSTVAPLPTAREWLGAATGIDGRIYAFGGNSNFAQNSRNVTYCYDPIKNTWTTGLAPMPTSRTDMAVVAGPDGFIYVIGGAYYDGQALNTVERYDPDTNMWSTMEPMPTARLAMRAALGPDGRIYAIGGSDAVNALNTAEAYDTHTGTWATLSPMPTPRLELGVAMGSDGRIYAIGGQTSTGALNSAEAYDTILNTWTTVSHMPIACRGFGCAKGADGRIFAVGGDPANNSLDMATLESYDAVTDAWTILAPMKTARTGLTAAEGADGRLYAIGGYNSSSNTDVDTVEAFTPQSLIVAIKAPTNREIVFGTVNVTGSISDMAPTGAWTLTCSGALIGSGTGKGVSVSWDTTKIEDGSHPLVLTAKDAVGYISKASVTVIVNNKGVTAIAITRPVNGGAVKGNVDITGEIYDASPGVWKLTDNGLQIGSGTGGSPNVPWNTAKVAEGSHTLLLTETDLIGHKGNASVTVTVNNTGVKSIQITAPADRAVVKGLVTVTGKISDATPGSWRLACSGALVGSGTGINPGIAWNTKQWANGSHTLVLQETDAAGNSSIAVIVVTVRN